ncbi:MAG: Flp family type IVb pilin [Armatimonadota bacterium]
MIWAIKRLLRDEAGVSSVEYALLLSVCVIASISAWQALGATIGNVLQESTTTIATGGE